MRIQAFRAAQLSPEHRQGWRHLQQSCQLFDSPYFQLEFTEIVARLRPQVEVAVLTEHGEAVGFFPYERGTSNIASPVGGVLSDYHGVIVRPGVSWSAEELLHSCGLSAWNFHHLLTGNHEFQAGYWRVVDAHYMDLSLGFEAYHQARREAGSQRIKNIARRKRKLERELGPVTVETDCRDERVFRKLLEWKSCQYQQEGLIDLLSVPWVEKLLRAIWQETESKFRGRLYAMYSGGELLAAELAMQSGPVLHSWFPVYDCRYAKYSPGHILRQEMAITATDLGICRIDLGKDEEPFKRSLSSGTIPIAEGSMDLNPIRRTLRKSGQQAVAWLKTTRLRDPLRRPYRKAKKLIHAARTFFEKTAKRPSPKILNESTSPVAK